MKPYCVLSIPDWIQSAEQAITAGQTAEQFLADLHPANRTNARSAFGVALSRRRVALAETVQRMIGQYSAAEIVRALGDEFNRRFWLGAGQTLIDLSCELETHPDYADGSSID